MKKTKKLAALVLAMVMAFSLMAVTASAYGAEEHDCAVCTEETIQPRKPAALCPKCAMPMTEIRTTWDGKIRYTEFWCPTDNTYITVEW